MDFDTDWAFLDSIDFDNPNWANELQFEYDAQVVDTSGWVDDYGLDGAASQQAIEAASIGVGKPVSLDENAAAKAMSDALASDTSIGGAGLLSEAQKWIKENPKLAQAALAAVGGAYTQNKARANSEAARRAIEEEKLRTRQRISDSITGIQQRQPSGLIPTMTRLDGSALYKNGGGLA